MTTFRKPSKPIVYEYDKLLRYGFNRLSEREFAREELRKKMANYQSDAEIVKQVLDKLEQSGYLSDYRRARSIYNQYQSKESFSKTKGRMSLKGVSREAIEQLMQEIEQLNDEKKEQMEAQGLDAVAPDVEKSFTLLKERFGIFDKEKYDKMVRFLASKGYRYNDISKAIKLLKEYTEE
jgi:SOS response regulatory protein OraA/RecX